jgi:hypothetical protein
VNKNKIYPPSSCLFHFHSFHPHSSPIYHTFIFSFPLLQFINFQLLILYSQLILHLFIKYYIYSRQILFVSSPVRTSPSFKTILNIISFTIFNYYIKNSTHQSATKSSNLQLSKFNHPVPMFVVVKYSKYFDNFIF